MKINGWIFDWDGTLCDSIPCGFEGTCEVFVQAGLNKPDFLEYVKYFGPPYTAFYRERGVTLTEEEIWKHYHFRAKHHENKIFDDVKSEVLWLRSLGHPVALVTGQSERMVKHLFGVHSCHELFDHIFADAGPSKTQYMRDACARMKCLPEETAAIGDFATDIQFALEAGVIPVGICRSPVDTTEVLMEAGAAFVVKELKELRKHLSEPILKA